MNGDDNLERLLLTKIRHSIARQFAPDLGPGVGAAARLEISVNAMGEAFAVTIFDFLGQRTDDRVFEWPATWWDAFKIRWFPDWLRYKLGVRMRRIRVRAIALCPQLNLGQFVPPGDRGRVHIEIERLAQTESAALGYVDRSAAGEARRCERAEQPFRRTHLVQLSVEESVVQLEE